jgi:hypothetical protein
VVMRTSHSSPIAVKSWHSSRMATKMSRSSRARSKNGTGRFCAYQISTPTPAEIAAINRYWTPLARSAVRLVSRGKMLVEAPKQHLSRAQRQALRRAEWAWRAFAPRPKLVCVRLPTLRGSRSHRASHLAGDRASHVAGAGAGEADERRLRGSGRGRGERRLGEHLVRRGEQADQVHAANQHLRRLERAQEQVRSGGRGGRQGAQPARAHAR